MSNERDRDSEPVEGEYDEDEMFQRRERQRHSSRVVSDFVRRAIENTVGQVQSTGALPKDALHYLIQQGDKGRKEIVRIVAKEVGDFLRHTDVSSEVVKILTNVQLDMSASIRFKRNPEGRLSTELGDDTHVSVTAPSAEEPPEATSRVRIDRDLLRFGRIWAAAGHPNAVFALTPADLQRLTGAPMADVAASTA